VVALRGEISQPLRDLDAYVRVSAHIGINIGKPATA
jgi:hypothetical protein